LPVKRDLRADQELLQTVLGLAQNREFVRAAAIADREIAKGFEHPLLLNVVATRLEQEGRFEEAALLLARAVKISPADVPARNALALCLQRLDRPAESLAHLEILLKAHPELSYAHSSKGNALIALGFLGQARACHLRALEIDPDNVAALSSLASIATHRGEHVDARHYATLVLARMPGYPDAVLSLAAAELAEGAPEKAEALLLGLLCDPRTSALDKARAAGLAGDVCDAMGRRADAFRAYAECNRSLREIHQRYARGPGVLAYARALAAALRAVESQWPARAAAPAAGSAAGPAAGHVFLIGFPRSGTTLLEVALDGHPGVVSAEELPLLTAGVQRYMAEPIDLRPLALADEAALEPLRTAYWNEVRAAGIAPAGRVFVDKYPLNTLKLPLIARLFPAAKVLFAVRDPRDVVLGCFRRRFRMNPAMYELLTVDGAAHFYDAVMEVAEIAAPMLQMAWRQVRYEDLIADFDREMRGILDFLGLEPVAGLGDFAGRATEREQATPSTAQLARGLDRSGIGLWREYATPLAPALPLVERWVDRFGYSA
jgi:tetratricopeptide (TPR) repeat protein